LATARVGITFLVNDAELKASLQKSSKLFVDSFGNLGSKVEGSMNAAMNGVVASTKRAATASSASFAETANAAKRAADAIAAGEKRMQDERVRLANVSTKRLIGEMKELQDKKAAIEIAITNEHDAEVKKRLQSERRAAADEIKIRKQIAMDRDDVQKGGAGARAGMMGTGRQMLDVMPGGGMLSGLAAGGPAAGIGLAAAGLQQIISIGGEFEDTMADMSAITGLQGEALKKAGDNAREVGMRYGVDGKGGVEAMKLVISALGPAVAKNEPMLKEMTNTTLQFAKAGGMDAAAATDALTVSLGQFGYASASTEVQAAQMARMANVQAAAAKEGSAEIDDLAASMKVAGATANGAKMSYEETATAIEMMAPAGIKGAEAGTALRNAILKMSSGTAEGNDALAKMGLTFADINPEKVGFTQALKTLEAKMTGIKDPVQKAAIMAKLFGAENSNAMTVLMKSSGQMDKFKESITGTNAAQEMAETKMATFNEQMAKLMVQVKDVAITLFDALKPALDLVMDGIQFLIPILKVVSPILMDMMTWVYQLAFAFGKWIAESAPVQAAMAWLSQAVKDVVAWVIQAWKAIQEWAAVMQQRLQPAIQWLQGALQSVMGFLRLVAQIIIANVVSAFNSLMSVVNAVGSAINWVVGAVTSAVTWVSNLGRSVQSLGGFFGFLLTPVKAVLSFIESLVEKAKWAIGIIRSIPGFGGDDAPKKEGGGGGGDGGINIVRQMGGQGGAIGGGIGQGGAIRQDGGGGGGGGNPKPPPPPKTATETKEQKAQRLFNAAKDAAEEAKAALYSKAEVERIDGKINDEQLKQRQLEADEKYYETLLKAATDYSQKTGEIERSIALNSARQRQATFEEEKRLLEDQQAGRLRAIEEAMDAGRMNDKEAKKAQIDAEILHLEALRQIMEQRGMDLKEINAKILNLTRQGAKANFDVRMAAVDYEFDMEMQKLMAQHENEGLAEEEFLAKQAEMYKRHAADLERIASEEGHGAASVGKAADSDRKKGEKLDRDAAKARDKRMAADQKEFEERNVVYRMGMEMLNSTVNQGLDWLDKGWQKSFGNQKTVLFQALTQMSGMLKGFVGDSLKALGKAAIEFIAKNAAIAGSWIMSAAASAWSWLSSLGPWGFVAGGVAALGIATQWKSIKKLFMAEGGVLTRPTSLGMVGDRQAIGGEAGAEAVIPLAKLPAMVGDINARSSSQQVMAAEIRALRQEINNRPVKTYVVASELEAILFQRDYDRNDRGA
jgi:TP901 family phage tail tape measure protein